MSNEIPMAPADQEAKPVDPATADYESGQTHLANGSMSLAANAFHNALVGYQENDNLEGVANANDKLGDVCLAMDHYDKALSHFEKAFEICKTADDLLSLLALRKKIIRCYNGMGQHEKAIIMQIEMIEFYQSMNNPGAVVETMLSMAETYKILGQANKAADAIRTAADIHANFKHQRIAANLRQQADELEQQH